MKRKNLIWISLCIVLIILNLSACHKEQHIEEKEQSKRIIIYYPNWRTYTNAKMSIDKLPWTKFTNVNHAFWTVNEDFSVESTDSWADVEWNQGYVALKDGTVINTITDSDGLVFVAREVTSLDVITESSLVAEYGGIKYIATDEQLDLNKADYTGQFAIYKSMLKKYPLVTVIVSVGGWSRSENFSQMASTSENRKIFVDSVVDLLKKYEWMGGIDLDWEYPSVDRLPSPDDPLDRGCPGDPENDGRNFSLLLKELREAFAANGFEDKIITICEYINADKLKEQQELPEVAKYVDYINIMSYDVYGAWRKDAGPLSPLKTPEHKDFPSVETSVSSFLKYFRPDQINIGSPFYSTGWAEVTLNEETKSPMWQISGPITEPFPTTFIGSWDAAPGVYGEYSSEWDTTGKWKLEKWPELLGYAYGTKGSGKEPWYFVKTLEETKGWIKGYDTDTESAWLYNADEKKMYSYENERSLQAKIDFVNEHNLSGMFMWEITGDSGDDGFPLMSILSDGLAIK